MRMNRPIPTWSAVSIPVAYGLVVLTAAFVYHGFSAKDLGLIVSTPAVQAVSLFGVPGTAATHPKASATAAHKK